MHKNSLLEAYHSLEIDLSFAIFIIVEGFKFGLNFISMYLQII